MNKPLDKKPQLLLFDVYETMLSMEQVERRVNQMLDSKRGYIIWFNLLMQQCFVDSLTGNFQRFNQIADIALQHARTLLHQTPRENEAQQLIELMKHLPVHENVAEGLSNLYDQGYRMAALTNSPVQVVTERMERTGLVSYFEQVLSAEQVKQYKPATAVYHWAAQKLQVEESAILLVSAHGWDIAGSQSAGMKSAWVARNVSMRYPLPVQPDIICKDLDELGQRLQVINKAT
jgi:2-haloacid dehalogenase